MGVGRERLLRVGSAQQLMSQKKNGGGQGGVSYLDQETRAPLQELKQVGRQRDKGKSTEFGCFPMIHAVCFIRDRL